MGRVQDKVAIVTGAGSGIGLATAELLAQEGATVVLTDIDEGAVGALAAALNQSGASAIHFAHDVGDEDAWIRVIDQTLGQFGRLDVLVNNAGVALLRTVEETTLEEWRALMRVNLDGVFLGVKHGIMAMRCKAEPGGSIINLSSIEGLVGDPRLAAYNASKGGVRLLTKSAALHCARSGTGVRVNSVHPGFIWTPMVEQHVRNARNSEAEERGIANLHPLGRMGRPEEIAAGILYLASDESLFVTGAELVIDGGYTAQ